jgi:hypothetical protein
MVEDCVLFSSLWNTIMKLNKALHLTALPLRFIAAGELGR